MSLFFERMHVYFRTLVSAKKRQAKNLPNPPIPSIASPASVVGLIIGLMLGVLPTSHELEKTPSDPVESRMFIPFVKFS